MVNTKFNVEGREKRERKGRGGRSQTVLQNTKCVHPSWKEESCYFKHHGRS
jgi:hypothetical protein